MKTDKALSLYWASKDIQRYKVFELTNPGMTITSFGVRYKNEL